MPERSDSEQEGVTLSPINTTRLVAEAAARQVIIEHIKLCPFAGSRVEERLRTLESRFALMIGLMLGSGFIGGATAATLAKLVTP